MNDVLGEGKGLRGALHSLAIRAIGSDKAGHPGSKDNSLRLGFAQ